MTKILLKLIEIYQKIFSPDHGILGYGHFSGCRFYPSCSEFSKEAIKKSGLIKALPKILKRILRCNPLSSGGVDPVT